MRAWPLRHVTHIDAGRCSHPLHPDLWRILLDNLSGATTVVLRPEMDIAAPLLETLLATLGTQTNRQSITNIVLDASRVTTLEDADLDDEDMISLHSVDGHARWVVMRILSFCAEAARRGHPLDTVEVVGDQEGRLLGRRDDVDWNELYRDLARGFV